MTNAGRSVVVSGMSAEQACGNQNDKLSISIFAVEDAQQGHGDDL